LFTTADKVPVEVPPVLPKLTAPEVIGFKLESFRTAVTVTKFPEFTALLLKVSVLCAAAGAPGTTVTAVVGDNCTPPTLTDKVCAVPATIPVYVVV
jgi:hypothetical protein